MSAPSLAAAMLASTKPRWLRHMIATPSPGPTPRVRSASASRLLRSCSSPKVSSPSSSTTPSRSGTRIAIEANPPAGPAPQRSSVVPTRASRCGG